MTIDVETQRWGQVDLLVYVIDYVPMSFRI